MAYPVFEENSILYPSNGGSVDIPYSGLTTINADDILVIFITNKGNELTFSTPAGWTKEAVIDATGASVSGALYWRRATGSESGNTTITTGSSAALIMGLLYRFSGCIASGTPFDSDTDTDWAFNTNRILIPTITTTVIETYCCAFFGIRDNNTQSVGVDYAEVVDLANTTYSDAATGLWSRTKATAGVVAADQINTSGSDSWVSFVGALKPISGTTHEATTTINVTSLTSTPILTAYTPFELFEFDSEATTEFLFNSPATVEKTFDSEATTEFIFNSNAT